MSTSTSTYVIPSPTDESRKITNAAEEALTKDPSVPVHEALGMGVAPTDKVCAQRIADAKAVVATLEHDAATFARLRFEGVRMALALNQIGKGRQYPTQTDLGKALGITQGRVSQMKTAIAVAEKRTATRAALKAAARKGGLDAKVEGLSSTIHSLSVDATPEQVKQAVVALESGKVPSGPARTMDVPALVKVAERLLTMTGDAVDVTADRDEIERVVKMLTTARANLVSAIRTTPANTSRAVDVVG
jgi:hypothetical protein